MTLPAETRQRHVESANASSKSRPVGCTHKVPKEVYDEVRPELRDPRNEERGSRSLGARSPKCQRTPQGPVQGHPAPLKVVAHMPHPQSPSRPPICRPCRRRKQQQAVPRRCPAASRSIANTLQTPVNCRAERGRSYRMCMLGRGSSLTDWQGAHTWDLDLPPLIRRRRRRWTRSSCETRRSTPRTRHLNFPNFWG